MTRRFTPFDRTRHLDRATIEEQFFRQCGLTRIGVRDDGEGTSLTDFID
jgi:hypothetical protein